MARIPVFPLLILAGLFTGLSTAVHAQVGVDISVDLGGAPGADAGAVGDAVGDAVGGAIDETAPGSGGAAATLDQAGAIEAVKSRRALPLEQIMTRARLYTAGEIVDAQLISLNGFLLYELKVVEANGDVDELYFYALSGELVRTN